MTIGEYQSLLQGYILKQQDDLEELSILAMFTAKASGFDKNGKPLVTKPSDLFDKEKAIKQLRRNGNLRRFLQDTSFGYTGVSFSSWEHGGSVQERLVERLDPPAKEGL